MEEPAQRFAAGAAQISGGSCTCAFSKDAVFTLFDEVPANSFRMNTYGQLRKCSFQKTYTKFNPFGMNTYRKTGGGGYDILT
jgi:hypothetical protein